MNVAEVRILKWMRGNLRKARRNECIPWKLEVTPLYSKWIKLFSCVSIVMIGYYEEYANLKLILLVPKRFRLDFASAYFNLK